jgi:serine protease Do
MTNLRRSIGVLAICVGITSGAMFGGNLIQWVQFAHAEQQVQTSRENLAKAEDISTVFRETSKALEPSVVNITVRKTIKGSRMRLPFDEDMLKKMFPDQNFDDAPDSPDSGGDRGPSFDQYGQGSGVIVDVDGKTGYIVTNNHVAGGAEEMTIALSDGRTIENAKLVGADPKSDIAVLKVESDGLIAAKWGDSSVLQKGDWVMAFGSPFGYVGSMTHGIVSALHRDRVGILSSPFAQENFIQVDAPINPGNSGGPLVNVRGEVIGINTAIASQSGGFQGIGFAIPSSQAKYVYQQLREKGKVVRGWLGVSISAAGDPRFRDLVESFGYTKKEGVFIQDVIKESPAAGKLQRGDIIEAVNDKPVKNDTELRNLIASTAPNTELDFTVFRKDKEQHVKVKIDEQPDELGGVASSKTKGEGPGENDTLSALGIDLKDLSDNIAEQLGVDKDTKGAVIMKVAPHSVAARKGLRPGDVITSVGDETVTTAREARDALKKADLTKGVRLSITGRDGSRFVFLKSATK